MRCAFYCTAESYDMDALARFFNEEECDPKLYGEAIHLQDGESDIIYFTYGCVVFWNMREDVERLRIQELLPYAKFPLSKVVEDSCIFEYRTRTHPLEEDKVIFESDREDVERFSVQDALCHTKFPLKKNEDLAKTETYISEEEDRIILESDDVLIKISLSYGLSQSVKLQFFEDTINETIEKTRHLPKELSVHGKTTLSRHQISQKVGELFAQRNSINLHCDVLDVPEFFWRRPKYEPYYQSASVYLDIKTRMDILNRRLEVIHDLYNILSDELKHSHSSRLEWIVILLILAEVFLHLFGLSK